MEDCAEAGIDEEPVQDEIMEDYADAGVEEDSDSDVNKEDYDNSDADPDYVPEDCLNDHGTCTPISSHSAYH